MHGEWLRKPTAGTSVVFVHGLLSSGDKGWRNKNGVYWPQLLIETPELQTTGVYVFSYQTTVFSGSYRLGDVVDSLKEHLRLDGLLESARIIFVCHSMGGIAVRKYVVERAADFIERDVEVGLFLIASPSLGSKYATWLGPLASFLGHAQIAALQFEQSNAWLNDLDKEFHNLKEAGRVRVKGKELVEDKSLVLKGVLKKQVVEPFSGARYFGEPFKVPLSDHFTIAKPENAGAIQHRLLCQFIKDLSTDDSEAASARSEVPYPQRADATPDQVLTVAFDQSYNQNQWFGDPTGNGGYNAAAHRLGQTRCILLGNGHSKPDSLSGVDVLVLPTPFRSYLEDQDYANIARWVQNGGGLVVLGIYLMDLHHRNNLNNLLRRLGLEFGHDLLMPLGRETFQDCMDQSFEYQNRDLWIVTTPKGHPVGHPLLENVQALALTSSCSVRSANKPALTVETSEPVAIFHAAGHKEPTGRLFHITQYNLDKRAPSPFLVAIPHGKGRVVAIGSWKVFLAEFIEDSALGNGQLWRNVISWLGEPKTLRSE